MKAEHYDVLIVGAGLSGIGAACHLSRNCPGKRFLIVEARQSMGGTWDLFRYPGIRSDSDMHTLGYSFKPWRAEKAIADGPAILSYIHETAREYDIDRHIRYDMRVISMEWSSNDARWQVECRSGDGSQKTEVSAGFVMMCAGYYNYHRAHMPDFPGRERFQGELIHPQFWPEDLDYRGKRVVIIGSGATAMTLVPAMAGDAAHVTMLQRSPTYVISRPDRDRIANALRRLLPDRWAYAITRWKNVTLQRWFYHRTRVAPQKVRKFLLDQVRKTLGPDYDVERHFTPDYNPWDQRLCLIPNDDLFDAIRDGNASVVTEEIAEFTPSGIRLASDEVLEADIIVSATGLELAILGEAELRVDGAPVDIADTWSYLGMMYTGVPNLITTFGYINASWTLRADITAEFACRLLTHMDERGVDQVVPTLRANDRNMPARDWIQDFTPGYMQRMMHRFPRQGDHQPWVNPQNYKQDRKYFREADLDDGTLVYSRAESVDDTYPEAPLKAAS